MAQVAMSKALKRIVDLCEGAQKEIDDQRLIIKGALDAGAEQAGLDPGAVRRLLAWRRAKAKDPTKRLQMDELDDLYRFLSEGGRGLEMPADADSEIDRVVALCVDGKPAPIALIRDKIGCSQGKASKLRSLAVARLEWKSDCDGRSSSSSSRELEPPAHDPETGEIVKEIRAKTTPASFMPSLSVWQGITQAREEWEERKRAEREAEKERRRAAKAERDRINAEIDADPLTIPAHLDRRAQVSA